MYNELLLPYESHSESSTETQSIVILLYEAETFAKCKVQVKSTSALGESRVSWENPAETSNIVTNFLQGNDRILENTPHCTLCLGTL